MTDRKLNEALRSMLTHELVGEIKRRAIFSVEVKGKELGNVHIPASVINNHVYCVVIARIP